MSARQTTHFSFFFIRGKNKNKTGRKLLLIARQLTSDRLTFATTEQFVHTQFGALCCILPDNLQTYSLLARCPQSRLILNKLKYTVRGKRRKIHRLRFFVTLSLKLKILLA